MSDLKIQHILTLTQLLSKGARYNFVQVTSTSLGKSIKKSQQAASTYLLELENNGLIERIMKGRKISVKITQKGYSEIAKLNSVLSSSLSSSTSNIELSGSVITGLGEGAYYMSLKGYTKQFKTKIGYIPFPGTLNIKLNQQHTVNCELIRLERTHHDNSVIELISKINLRKTVGLKTNSKVRIKILISNSS